MIFTNTSLTKDNIIFDFDISNTKSYDSNTGFTLTSLTFWDNYTLSDLTLTGYGQTMYDFGLTTSYTESKSYTLKDRNLVFNRIGYNDASGYTTFPQITLGTGSEGNSLVLSGGYLTSFFKIPEKTFQLATYRNGVGFTIDTWIHLDQNAFDKITSYTEGFFVYLGTKAENKFNIFYSASTDNLGTGFTYDTSSYLNDIEYNAVGFKFNNDKTLSIRYLGISGLTEEILIDKPITTTGWTNIAFTFRYCNKIITNCDNSNSELIDCVAPREGDLKIFVNGKLFFEKDCVEEFLWLKQLNTDADKQIGLPYSINWGGGSFGLKHSFLPSITSYTAFSAVTTGTTYILTSGATNILVDGNFGTFEGASGTTSGDTTGVTTDVYDSILTATTAVTYTGTNSLLIYASPSAITNIVITALSYTPLTNIITDGDNGTFESNINGISTPLTNGTLNQVVGASNYLGLFNNGGSVGGFTDVNGYSFIQFDTPFDLSADTKYIFSGTVWDFAQTYTSDKNIFLGFLDGFETSCTTVSSVTFNSGSTGNNFYDLYYEFFTPSANTTGKTLTIKTNNTTLFNTNFYLYFDNFELIPHLTGSQTAFTTSFTFSTLTNNLVVFNTPINLSTNKTYIYQGKFYDDNSYISGSNKNVYLTFSGGLDSEITVVSSITYTSETSAATWNDLQLIFITPSAFTSTTSYTPIIKVDYTTGITAGYKFYFDEFSIAEYDLINLTALTAYTVTEEILLNKNLKSIIKDNFDGSFYGKIQKLRMYDVDLDFTEIKKNYNYYSSKYGFKKLK